MSEDTETTRTNDGLMDGLSVTSKSHVEKDLCTKSADKENGGHGTGTNTGPGPVIGEHTGTAEFDDPALANTPGDSHDTVLKNDSDRAKVDPHCP